MRKKTHTTRRIILLALALGISACHSPTQRSPGQCPDTQSGAKQLLWGDLHVHTAYSLDAYGYGTIATPADAYRFAKGHAIDLPDGSTVKLARPLDFTAVTDHAEWFDLMYVCTQPLFSNDPYCEILREHSGPVDGGKVFAEYVLPTITLEAPQITPICEADPDGCLQAARNQWQRIQDQANAAYEPCEFTSFIGFEWSATPDYSHTHRNVIFANDKVPNQAIDYIRFPALQDLFTQLDKTCRPENGCDAITIPHNNNMGDGIGFDVETDSDRMLGYRQRFERLIEVHQEKGNSECLSPFAAEDENDCAFEQYLTRRSRPTDAADYNEEEWERMRASYARSLLLRGLEAYADSTHRHRNPLQLGMIGSTDGHTATPGHVEEDAWHGSAFGAGSFEREMLRVDWNPGGLIGVWAEENTRESLFAAMKRREVFATSGPRIKLRFSAATDDQTLTCAKGSGGNVTMGADFDQSAGAPSFRIEVEPDQTPVQWIEIIKGEWTEAGAVETVIDVTPGKLQDDSTCLTWTDPQFNAGAPAFWYVRVHEQATERWSAKLCKAADRCDEYPSADRTVQERAWSSPIWYFPPYTVRRLSD